MKDCLATADLERDMAYELDLREMVAPWTLLKVTQAFRRLRPEETLEVLGSDVQTRKDLFKVLCPLDCELVSLENHMAFYRVRLKKRGPG